MTLGRGSPCPQAAAPSGRDTVLSRRGGRSAAWPARGLRPPDFQRRPSRGPRLLEAPSRPVCAAASHTGCGIGELPEFCPLANWGCPPRRGGRRWGAGWRRAGPRPFFCSFYPRRFLFSGSRVVRSKAPSSHRTVTAPQTTRTTCRCPGRVGVCGCDSHAGSWACSYPILFLVILLIRFFFIDF